MMLYLIIVEWDFVRVGFFRDLGVLGVLRALRVLGVLRALRVLRFSQTLRLFKQRLI